MTGRDIEIGDFVRSEQGEGVVLKLLDDSMGVFDTGYKLRTVYFDDIIEVSDLNVELLKGVSDSEREEYERKITDIEEQQGQQQKGTYAEYAISSLNGLWVIDDVEELCGYPKPTARRAIEKEQTKGYCTVVGGAKTGGRPTTVYKTINQGDSQ